MGGGNFCRIFAQIYITMNQLRFFLITFLCLFVGSKANAAGTKIGNLYYNLDSETLTASVTYAANSNENLKYYGCGYRLSTVEIPETVTYQSNVYTVTSIGSSAFTEDAPGADQYLRTVVIPASVRSIGSSAFSGCKWLSSVVFEDASSVETISSYAFQDCSAATFSGTEFTNLTTIGYQAFYNCKKLSEFSAPLLTNIPSNAFYSCGSMKTCHLPALTTIGEMAFFSCRFESFTIPATVTTIPGDSFYNSTAEKLTIEDSEEPLNIELYSYYENGNKYYQLRSLPGSVIYVGRNLAYDNKTAVRRTSPVTGKAVTSVEFGPLVTELGSYFFNGSKADTGRLIIPSTILNIDTHAYYLADVPGAIYYDCSNPVDIATDAFTTDIYSTSELHIPKGTMQKYLGCKGWQNFLKIIDDVEPAVTEPETPEKPVVTGANHYLFMAPDEDRSLTSLVEGTVASWESSDEDVVEVTRRGLAYAYEFGEALVTAKDAAGNVLSRIAIFVSPTVSVVYPEGGTVRTRTIYNAAAELDLHPSDGWRINSVTHDNEDVTNLVDATGHYTTAPVTNHTEIRLALEKSPATALPGDVMGTSAIKVTTNGLTINIQGAAGAEVTVSNIAGKVVYTGRESVITLPVADIYLVTIGTETFKVIL